MKYNDDNQLSVLLAETDPMCRRAVAYLLKNRCKVTASTKYYKIIEMMHYFEFHSLYVDYNLAFPGAIALLKEARQIAPNTKRVLMSSEQVDNLQRYINNRLIHAVVSRASTGVEILRAVMSPIA